MQINDILADWSQNMFAAQQKFVRDISEFLYQPEGKLVILPDDNVAYFNQTRKMRIAVYNGWMEVFARPIQPRDIPAVYNYVIFETEQLSYKVHFVYSSPTYANGGITGFQDDIRAHHYMVGARTLDVPALDSGNPLTRDEVIGRLNAFAKKVASAQKTALNKQDKTLADAQTKLITNAQNMAKRIEEHNKRYSYR